MSIAQATKSIVKTKIKKAIFKVIKPYIPLILLIIVIILLLATLLDTLFINGVQASDYTMSEAELLLKNKCIEKARVINICNNFVDGVSTNKLLDVNNREENKQIEWSHLYSLMTIESLQRSDISQDDLLEQIANNLISTFKYETNTITTETKSTDKDGKETWSVTATESEFILIESDTIIGHYTYHYETQTTLSDDGNTKTTKKVYKSQKLISEQYAMLKDYLQYKAGVRKSDIDTMVALVIDSASGYYNSSNKNNSSIYIGNGMFTWPIPGYSTITSEYGYRVDPITR